MENRANDPVQELPREEALSRLYELRDRLEREIVARGVLNPRSESERHLATHGHRLAFGCCRPLDDAVTASQARARAL